jgi:uncharacterized damage-inducible protein DinB
MDGAELIADALGRINRTLHRSMEGVPAETLNKQPSPSTNSMTWLAWHLTRVQDHHISDLLGVPELWVSGGWHEKFGQAADEKNTGTGHTPEQVAALTVDSADVPLGYSDAVLERARGYLATVKPETLDETIDESQYDPLPTVGTRLVSIVSDNTQHAGQVAYVRGLLEGPGWQQF